MYIKGIISNGIQNKYTYISYYRHPTHQPGNIHTHTSMRAHVPGRQKQKEVNKIKANRLIENQLELYQLNLYKEI